MNTNEFKIIQNPIVVLIIYISIAVIIGLQHYFIGRYNNFLIFQHSVFHFFEYKNLYLEYPKEYYDLFLYSPSFPLLFIPFAYLPALFGIILWNVFNVIIYYKSLMVLELNKYQRLFIFYLIIPELITSVANSQTNPILVAFIILTMVYSNQNKDFKATFFPSINFFIKGYGGIAYIFFLFRMPTFKKFLQIFLSFIIIFLLPLIFYSPHNFKFLYQDWYGSMKQDYSINTGISMMGVIKSLIYKDASIPLIQLIGVAILLGSIIVILLRRNYEQIKYIFLANILIFTVIFNQAAESPTYIIASTGVFIWYLKTERTWITILLFVFFYFLTVLSPTDIFPRYLRDQYVKPYSLKALPCIITWLIIQIQLFFPNLNSRTIKLWKRKLI